MFYAHFGEYQRLLGSRQGTINELEDRAGEAMMCAHGLFEHLARGGHPPDWSTR